MIWDQQDLTYTGIIRHTQLNQCSTLASLKSTLHWKLFPIQCCCPQYESSPQFPTGRKEPVG